jgi:hypothetical protein
MGLLLRSRANRALFTAIVVLTLGSAGRAAAQTAPRDLSGHAQPPAGGAPGPGTLEARPPRDEGRGPFGLLLHLGAFTGLGAGVTAGTPDVGVRASVGWTPILALLTSGSESDLHFYSGLLVSPDVYVRLFSPRPTTHVGLEAGYRYSSLLGHGAALGGYAQFAVGRAFDGLISAGLLLFPDGEDRLKRDENLPASTSFSFPGPSVNFGVSLGLAFFP